MTHFTTRAGCICAALVGVMVGGHACLAGEAAPATLSPNRGASFSVGSVRLVTHYQTSGGLCNLSVHVMEPTDGVPTAPVTRYEAQVLPGKSVQVSAGAEAVEFGCKVGGQSMSVTPLRRLAWSKSTS